MPVYNDTGAIIDYLKDADGNTVISRLEASTLRQLAEAGSGAYYQAELDGSATAALLKGSIRAEAR